MTRILGFLLVAAFPLLAGCSKSNPASEAETSSAVLGVPDVVYGANNPFVGEWTPTNGEGTLAIRTRGNNLFQLKFEGERGGWEGIGRAWEDRMVTIFWYKWHVDAAQADRHGMAAFWVDGDDLGYQAVNADGTLAYPGSYRRVN